MRLRITTDTSLQQPDQLEGYIAWHEVDVQDLDDAHDLRVIGMARAGVVNSFYLRDKVRRTNHPDRDEIEPLHPLILAIDPHEAGRDVLYFSRIEIPPERQGRNIELAVVLRVCELLGIGCSFAAIRVETPEEVEYWGRIGFARTAGTDRLVHLDLDHLAPPLVHDDDDTGCFEIVPFQPRVDIRKQN